MVTVTYRKMRDAPRDGSDIIIKTRNGERHVFFTDCTWLREPTHLPSGKFIEGDPTVADCWRRVDGGGDIELNEALGWRPA